MLTAEVLRAAREAAAVGPLLAPAVLRFAGGDARSFLHRMSTQDLLKLAPGESAYAAFLNAKGHLLGEGDVLAGDGEALLLVAPAAAAAVREHLERYVVADDVTVEEGPALRVLPLLGPTAPRRLGDRGQGALRVANRRRGAPCLDLGLAPAAGDELRAALLAEGWPGLSDEDLEGLRIVGGVPRFGAELDGSRLPMEAGLTRDAISFTKGCYIGQEVVVRATVRGHLNRGLVQVALPPEAGPGTPLLADGIEVGRVTSAAATPQGRVGLAYLRRAHWHPGERLTAGGGEAVVTRVIVEEGPA
ncbi:MAG TPA: folate-binding protein [Anaeromyxobacter sp.]|nr:folate-binding protein [Anaeromyxobacter sp.]